MENEVLASFVLFSTLLILKMYAVAIITGQVRLRKKLNLRTCSFGVCHGTTSSWGDENSFWTEGSALHLRSYSSLCLLDAISWFLLKHLLRQRRDASPA
uniref:Uncharacterized protein n=1 Tax=Sphaerodactylus townsendi TaxID=933632 RepID=A0ACB8F0R0_9SAUR